MMRNKRNKLKTLSILISLLLFFINVGKFEVRADDTISNNADLVSIYINGQRINVIDPWISNYDMELPINTPEDLLSVVGEPYDLKSIVSVEGNKLVNNCALVKIIVTAEDNVSKRTYYVNVTLKEAGLDGSFTDIKTADFHSIALKSNGILYSFGENNFGQLGDGTRKTRTKPVQIKGLSNVIDFDTSNSHSIAVTSDGSVWVWGLNDYGQLYGGDRNDVLTPVKINELHDIVKVRSGNRYSLALDSNGVVWKFGYNSKGQFEDETENANLKPMPIKELKDIKVIDIETGDFHSLVLSAEGNVYAWGANDFGQLGDGTLINRYAPVKLSGLPGVRYINAKGNTSSCITEDGDALLWGETNYPEDRNILTPEAVQGIDEPLYTEFNNNNIVELSKDGTVYSSGSNKYGQLGDGTDIDRTSIESIYDMGSVKKISTSPYNIFMLGEGGYIYALGRNEIGQLGIDTTGNYMSTPQKLSEFNDSKVDMVYANRNSGEVDENTVINLATDTVNSKIYYTLNGSDPTDKSIPYSQPITVTRYTVIKAVAVKNGKYSAVSTFEYIISNKAGTELNITIGTKSTDEGIVVEIPIKFSNVPKTGISKLKFAIQFNPEIMEIYDVIPDDIITNSEDFDYYVSSDSDDTLILSFSSSSKNNYISESGNFAVLKLYITGNASPGKWSISQVFTSGEGFYSSSNSKLKVYYNAGYVDTNMLYGDVDGDKRVTALDLQYVQRYVSDNVSYFPESKGYEAADINKDGKITLSDIELIKKLILRGK
jgi:alpha-tubulin suppressor-like RCC1 family protein